MNSKEIAKDMKKDLFSLCAIAVAITLSVVSIVTFHDSKSSRSDSFNEICKLEADNSLLEFRNKVLAEQVRQLKALIPTNVTLNIELSNIIGNGKAPGQK